MDTGIPAAMGHRRVTPGSRCPAPTGDILLTALGMPQATVSPGTGQRGPAGTQLGPEPVAPTQDLAGMRPAPLQSSSQARPSSLCLRSCVPGQEEAFYLLILFLA